MSQACSSDLSIVNSFIEVPVVQVRDVPLNLKLRYSPCTSAGENYIYPEYDSIRGLVLETGRSYQDIYQKAVEEAWKKKSND